MKYYDMYVPYHKRFVDIAPSPVDCPPLPFCGRGGFHDETWGTSYPFFILLHSVVSTEAGKINLQNNLTVFKT